MFKSLFCVIAAAILILTVASSSVFAKVDISYTRCRNTTQCEGNCYTQHLQTGVCYTDRATGQAVMLSCLRNNSWFCFVGRGYSDVGCSMRSEISRNSLTCNSCTGSSNFRCNKFEKSVTQYVGCHDCGNCSTAYHFQEHHCKKMPGGTFAMIDSLEFCGLTMIQQVFAGSTCDGRSYQIGIPSKFCGASRTNSSSSFTCMGVDGKNGVLTGLKAGSFKPVATYDFNLPKDLIF